MTKYGKKLQLTMLSALVATLAACGGGGGGDTAATPAPVPAPAPTPGTPPTSTYAAGSAQKAMFDSLNQVRVNGGFGALLQDASLDVAAKAHADYTTINYFPAGVVDPAYFTIQASGAPGGHFETAGRFGYTGDTPAARISATGYGAGATVTFNEVGGAYFGASRGTEPDMTRCLAGQLNTVFHRAAVLDTAKQNVGIGIGTAVTDANGFILRPCVIDMASKTPAAVQPAGWTGVYPFSGQTNVALTMEAESPDPVPTVAVKGFPVSLQTASDQVLTVSTFSLRDSAGAVLNTVLLTRAVTTSLRNNEAYLVPIGALKASTTYTASFVGTSSGNGINRTWSFTTGQ